MKVNRIGSADKSKIDKRYQYYRCSKKHNTARIDNIDQQVIDFLLSDRLPEQWKAAAVFPMMEGITERSIEERTTEVREKIKRLDYRWDQGFITDIEEFTKQRTELQAIWDQLEPLKDASYEQAIDIIYNLKKHWELTQGDLHEQRKLVKTIIERVYIQDRRLQLSFCALALGTLCQMRTLFATA
jgi:hypothetical protein